MFCMAVTEAEARAQFDPFQMKYGTAAAGHRSAQNRRAEGAGHNVRDRTA
jgi:hypothetical protein